MKTRDEKLAYAKGYSAGLNGRWPEHKPPAPPDPVIAEIIKATRSLRNAADAICSTLDEADDFVVSLGPKIDACDEAMIAVTAWLKNKECDE